ncbi:hypothetical protein B0H13DRAFT_2664347 [Mycena leptocephala]|nr:hypothetical protein B0H13DRAFT_2664347 [Mycena leptocephala]
MSDLGHVSPKNGPGAIFGLIIGINKYYNTNELPTLLGAVNDARDFENYLLDLGVPRSNILRLENENATRSAILSTFRTHLLNNTNIPDHGDTTMILFFAGHGSSFEAPSDLIAPNGRVEAMCPVDERTKNETGEDVHAIPDYVLVRLLSELADKKGNNITVILDCCHSSGMERAVKGLRMYVLPGRTPVPFPCTSTVIFGKARMIPCSLSACGPSPRRLMSYWRRVVRTRRPERRRVATESIMVALPEVSSPSYGKLHLGERTDPILRRRQEQSTIWNGNYPAPGRRSVLLTPSKSASSLELFRVEMGTVEGVVPGTEFSAYDWKNNYLCTFTAQSVRVGETILVWKPEKDQPPVDIPPWSRAVVSYWKSSPMLVHALADFLHTNVLFPTTSTVRPPNFVPAPSVEEAHIVVRSDDDEIVIAPRTSTVLAGLPKPGLPSVTPPTSPTYFLGCANEANRLEGVELEMYRLRGEYPCCTPDLQVGNLIKDGVVGLTSEVGTQYGFTIRNTSEGDLFPYLLYFDPETYTIQNWYSPAAAGVEPPLQSREGMLSSRGFLKLFVTSDYIDFGWIQQELSPFDPGAPPRDDVSARARYQHVLNALSTLCGPPPLFATLVEALTRRLTAIAFPSLFSSGGGEEDLSLFSCLMYSISD